MGNVMKLDDLLDTAALADEIAAGFVRTQSHPTEPLAIYNYTQQAQYAKRWNDITKQCRGLIVDYTTREVVARPFPKFFNYGEHTQDSLPSSDSRHSVGGVTLTESVRITEKLDGSLGIVYPTSDGNFAVATRGSFTSPQAQHATRLLHEQYATFLRQFSVTDATYLVEILYPENRIVVDYHGFNDLVLLDVLLNTNGRSVLDWARITWPGPVVPSHEFSDWRDALKVQRDNHEGFVVHFFHADVRVKIKHEDYVRLHRLITNVSSTTIWESLASNQPLTELVDNVPDEFFDWLTGVAAALFRDFAWRKHEAHSEMKHCLVEADIGWAVRDGVPGPWGPVPAYARKKFAEAALKRQPELRPLLFNLLDRKSIDAAIWRQIKPEHERPFASLAEEAA